MRTRIPLLVMGMALMISACQKDELLAPTPKSEDLSLQPITDITWVLQRDRDGQYPAHPGSQAPWFLLASRGETVRGNTACNDIMGRYLMAGDNLRFMPLAQTRRYCADVMDVEDRYLAVLAATDGYRLGRDGMLTLMSDGQELAWFAKR